MRLPYVKFAVRFVLVVSALASLPGTASKGGGGGGSSSGGGRGGTSTGSRGSSGGGTGGGGGGARGGGPARVVPSVPKWSSASNGFRGGVPVRYRNPVAAPLVGFYMGYLLSSGFNDASTIAAAGQCEGCQFIRDGLKTCLNTDVSPSTQPNQTLAFGTDPELDSECYCSQLAPGVYDQCFQCAPNIPVEIRTESLRLRDECDAYLTSGAGQDWHISLPVSMALAGVGTVFLLL